MSLKQEIEKLLARELVEAAKAKGKQVLEDMRVALKAKDGALPQPVFDEAETLFDSVMDVATNLNVGDGQGKAGDNEFRFLLMDSLERRLSAYGTNWPAIAERTHEGHQQVELVGADAYDATVKRLLPTAFRAALKRYRGEARGPKSHPWMVLEEPLRLSVMTSQRKWKDVEAVFFVRTRDRRDLKKQLDSANKTFRFWGRLKKQQDMGWTDGPHL